MKILEEREIAGPSILGAVPVYRLLIADDHGGAPLLYLADMLRRLEPAVPKLAACLDAAAWPTAKDRPGGFRDRVELAGHVALALQHEYEFNVDYVRAFPLDAADRSILAYAYRDSFVGRFAGRMAVALVNAAADAAGHGASAAGGDDVPIRLRAQFETHVKSFAPNIDVVRVALEADRRGVPWVRIHNDTPILQFGWGHHQRRFWRVTTERTSNIAIILATQKHVANAMLRAAGLPAPHSFVTRTADEAVLAAAAIGYPVVVKPTSGDMGAGVTVNIPDEAGVRRAFALAMEQKAGLVMVEQLIPGNYHRLTCINFRLKAADRRISARIKGDGKRTAGQLVDALVLRRPIDRETIVASLATSGYSLDSVIPADVTVMLKPDLVTLPSWTSVGDSMMEPMMHRIHPDNVLLAERAARVFNLDLAGIDFITPDISRSWREGLGAINEVNGHCGLDNTYRAGHPDIYRDVLEAMVPPGEDGRIPLVTVLGRTVAAGLLAMLATLLRHTGHKVGMTTAAGSSVGDNRLLDGDQRGTAGMRSVLLDADATAAVFHLSIAAIVAEGLAFDAANVSLVLDVEDCAAADGSTGATAEAYRLAAGLAKDAVVLNADAPDVAALRPASRAARIIWVTTDLRSPLVRERIAAGDSAVMLERTDPGIEIAVVDNHRRSTLRLGRTLQHRAHPAPQDPLRAILFALAAAEGLGISVELAAESIAHTNVAAAAGL